MDYVFGKGKGPELPVVVMATDPVQLAGRGRSGGEERSLADRGDWQRWNDYGIGLLLEGATKGGQKGELKQAEEVFRKVAELGRADGWVNLARVYQKEGRIPDALAALEKAAAAQGAAAPWVINWLTGQINVRNGMLDEAITSFESVLKTRVPERKFDFSLDFEVINELGSALYARSSIEPVKSPERARVPQEGDRDLSADAGDRLRGRHRPLRAWPRLSATRPGGRRDPVENGHGQPRRSIPTSW